MTKISSSVVLVLGDRFNIIYKICQQSVTVDKQNQSVQNLNANKSSRVETILIVTFPVEVMLKLMYSVSVLVHNSLPTLPENSEMLQVMLFKSKVVRSPFQCTLDQR